MISFEDYKAFVAKLRSQEDGERFRHWGRTAEEIKFHEGDIVEFDSFSRKDGEFHPTLGVVIAGPATLEQKWERVKDLPNLDALESWGKWKIEFSDNYLVATGRFQPNLYHYDFAWERTLRLPSEPVSDEECAKIMGWYDEAIEGRKNYILPGLGPEAEAYAVRYKEIEPIVALEALAHMYVDQCGVSRGCRTVAFNAAEQWMKVLSKTDHPLAAQTLRPLRNDDLRGCSILRSFVEFIPLINDDLAQHREIVERYDICYLSAEDLACIADMLYHEYDEDTTRIALCYGVKCAIKEELHSDRKLRKFLGTI